MYLPSKLCNNESSLNKASTDLDQPSHRVKYSLEFQPNRSLLIELVVIINELLIEISKSFTIEKEIFNIITTNSPPQTVYVSYPAPTL